MPLPQHFPSEGSFAFAEETNAHQGAEILERRIDEIAKILAEETGASSVGKIPAMNTPEFFGRRHRRYTW